MSAENIQKGFEGQVVPKCRFHVWNGQSSEYKVFLELILAALMQKLSDQEWHTERRNEQQQFSSSVWLDCVVWGLLLCEEHHIHHKVWTLLAHLHVQLLGKHSLNTSPLFCLLMKAASGETCFKSLCGGDILKQITCLHSSSDVLDDLTRPYMAPPTLKLILNNHLKNISKSTSQAYL